MRVRASLTRVPAFELGVLGLLCIFAAFMATPVRAASPGNPSDGMFENDGNAIQDTNTDWEDLYDECGVGADCDCSGADASCLLYTFIEDVTNDTIFEQSNAKDIIDSSLWTYKSGTANPAKNDITNAYAAAFECDAAAAATGACTLGDVILHFGADRFTNNGDADLGFWFLTNDVTLTGGNFVTAGHADLQDFLVNVLWPQGTNAEPVINVYQWDSSCTGDDGTGIGGCKADNLRLAARAAGLGNVACSAALGDYCAITNDEVDGLGNDIGTIDAPWPYDAKSNVEDNGGCTIKDPDCFPFETFFEGAINLSATFPELSCVSTFMAETRSSGGGGGGGETAQLKDFAIGDFDLCGSSATKVCVNDDESDDDITAITYNVYGCAINSGVASIDVDQVLNSINGPGSPSTGTISYYVPGQVDNGSGGLRDFDPDTDCDQATAAAMKEAISNGSVTTLPHTLAAGHALIYTFIETTPNRQESDTVTVKTSFGTTDLADATADAQCPDRVFNASLTVDKTCNADLELDTSTDPDRVVVKIDFGGQICNTGEVQLTSVSLADNPAATFGTYEHTLEPAGDPQNKDCTTYTGYYYPTSIPSADICPFADKVMVTAVAPDNVVLGSGCEENESTGVVECTAESTLETCDLRATNGDNDCSTGPDSP